MQKRLPANVHTPCFFSVRTLPHFLSHLARLAQHEQVQTPAWPRWLKQTPNGFTFIFHIISSLLIWAYLWPGRIQGEERAPLGLWVQVQFSVLAVREILFWLETCLNFPWNWLWENTNEPPPSSLKTHSSHYLLLEEAGWPRASTSPGLSASQLLN